MDDVTPLYWGMHASSYPLRGIRLHCNLRTIIRKTCCFIDAETHTMPNKPSGRIVAKPHK